MPQWTVEGANKATGVETTLLVEAPNDAAARDVASAQGLAVASVMPSDQHQTLQHHLHYQTGQERFRPVGFLARYLTPDFLARTLLFIAVTLYLAALAQIVFSIIISTGAAGSSFGRGMDGLYRFLTSVTQATLTAVWGGAVHLVAVFTPILAHRLSSPKR